MAKKINSVFIATFAPWKDGKRESTNGMIEPLLYYFKPRLKKIYLLEQPYPGSDRVIPFVHTFTNGKEKTKDNFFTKALYPILKYENTPGTKISFKLRDFISVIETGLSFDKSVDLFIGLESINALAGILLKKMGKVKTVAYYVSDYSPNRYPSKLFNSFYLYLDRLCAKHADYIWDVSKAMQPARLKEGLKENESKPVIDIPNALFKEQISFSDKKKSLTAVFVGTLGLANGPDLAIEAFSIVVKKYPKAMLHIIGGRGAGHEEKHLEKLIKKGKLEKKCNYAWLYI
jgi:glycosyltransferase involved in cell wall biosynthesis